MAEVELEMFEDLLAQRQEILESLEEGGQDARERAELNDRLSSINKVFGYAADLGEDDLIDEWERDLAEGRVPDLSKRTVG